MEGYGELLQPAIAAWYPSPILDKLLFIAGSKSVVWYQVLVVNSAPMMYSAAYRRTLVMGVLDRCLGLSKACERHELPSIQDSGDISRVDT